MLSVSSVASQCRAQVAGAWHTAQQQATGRSLSQVPSKALMHTVLGAGHWCSTCEARRNSAASETPHQCIRPQTGRSSKEAGSTWCMRSECTRCLTWAALLTGECTQGLQHLQPAPARGAEATSHAVHCAVPVPLQGLGKQSCQVHNMYRVLSGGAMV